MTPDACVHIVTFLLSDFYQLLLIRSIFVDIFFDGVSGIFRWCEWDFEDSSSAVLHTGVGQLWPGAIVRPSHICLISQQTQQWSQISAGVAGTKNMVPTIPSLIDPQ